MNIQSIRALLLIAFSVFGSFQYTFAWSGNKEILVLWRQEKANGKVQVDNGDLVKLSFDQGKGKIKGNDFSILTAQSKLKISVSNARTELGPEATVIRIESGAKSFAFFLRDVQQSNPIYNPSLGVMVLPANDKRSFNEVEEYILVQRNQTKIQQIEDQPEQSFEKALADTRSMHVPIWLGISRDMRMFEIAEEMEDTGNEGKIIRPLYGTRSAGIPESEYQSYIYALGRGVGARVSVKRKLDEGILPIYHSEMQDDDIRYHTTSFVSFAKSDLTMENNQGTNYMVSDKHSSGRTFKEEHMARLNEQMKHAYDFKEPMVLYASTSIRNTGKVPRYAWIKNPRPGNTWWFKRNYNFDINTGMATYPNGQVFCVSKLNGKPLNNEEIAILLQPGEEAIYEFYLPHTPMKLAEAQELQGINIADRLQQARSYWKKKLASAAQISVPEKRINQMLHAGLLHLDLISFGEEPHGIVSANIGVYSPIGTESSPIIQYYLSMGWNDLAKRAILYFLDTQLSSGYIQNYEGYTVETGAVLWTIGEYIRYTQDYEWLKTVQEKVAKSCSYLLSWRERNKKEELRGRGYGLIDGKVADPEDHYHQFMLNGYAYLGLKRIAEAYKNVDNQFSNHLAKESQEWKSDILSTVETLYGISPLIPLGDGTWGRTLPPWAEADGPRALFQKHESYWSHGTFTGADAMLGPMYLVFCEIIDADSKEALDILKFNSELFFQGNSAFSQPYYSRHNWLQAKLGMVKPFLSTYYNTVAAHADRETYTFWEHYYRVSPHKTHEEAWFLMESRWMLYMEDGDQLQLFKTMPRAWLANGKEIKIKGAQSYFGLFDAHITSNTDAGFIEGIIKLDPSRKPKKLTIRIPHPDELKPRQVIGGDYSAETETITINNPANQVEIKLVF